MIVQSVYRPIHQQQFGLAKHGPANTDPPLLSTSHIATSRPAGPRYRAGQPHVGSEPCQTLTLELVHQTDPSQARVLGRTFLHDKTMPDLEVRKFR